MQSYIIIEFLCVIQASALSSLTDDETRNVTLRDELMDTKTDVFKLLLNQETLIRMSLVRDVNSLLKDMVDMKESMTNSNDRLYDVKKAMSSLKNELQLLKYENQKLKEQAAKFQEKFNTTDIRFNITEIQYEKNFNEQLKEFEKNTSSILNSIKIEATDLFVRLLDLSERTPELNMSIPNQIDSKILDYSTKVNASIREINYKLHSAKDFQQQLVYNLSALEHDLKSIRNIMSEMKTSVGFTVGMTSTSRTWSGDIFVFPKVITNNGNGYDPSTGKFTAPLAATYVFFVHVNAHSSNHLYIDIVLNGSSQVRTMAHNSAQYRTGTNMAVLQLVKGDSVWVSRFSGQSYFTHSVPITTFSGFSLS